MPSVVRANAPQNITAGELALTPEYCPHSQTFAPGIYSVGSPTPAQRPWVNLMGNGFWTVHHYCWALISAHRATQAGLPASQRGYLYQSAVDDAYYVINNAGADFVLLPEIYYRVGQFYVELGEPIRAMASFEKSFALKPDYWPAYLGLAQINERVGRRDAAIEVLNAGLARVPDQPELSAALRKLSQPLTPPKRTRAAQASRP